MLKFTNPANITKWEDMPKEMAKQINSIIDSYNLPSYSYPEMYQYLTDTDTDSESGVVNGKIMQDEFGPYIYFNNIDTFNETLTQIKYLDRENELFFKFKTKENNEFICV